MKRYFLSIFAAAFVISSCVQDIKVETEDELPGDEDVEVVVPESQELSITAGNATKTVLDSDGHIRWESGDQLSVVFNHETEGASVSGDFKTEFEDGPALTAIFSGTFDADLDGENYNGYQNAFAVYPHTAVDEDGSLVFELPVTQTAVEGGSFAKGYNLSSSALSLDEVMTGSATAAFKNALTFLRFKVDDAVKSITFTGTAPLAGGAPLAVYFSPDPEDPEKDHGRLVLQPEGEWSNPSVSVTLVPETGCENFQSGGSHQYNLLIWPGTHNSLKITLDYGEPYGTYDLINNFGGKEKVFSVNKYYNLNFPSDLASILSNAEKKIEIVENDLADLGETIGGLEDQVGGLVNQIQSVSLLTETLGNEVYAKYAQMTYSKQKLDLILDYIIRPESAIDGLIEAFNADPSVVSAVYGYTNNGKFELAGGQLSVNSLEAKDLPGVGKVVTASVSAGSLSEDFYNGYIGASVALQITAGKSSIISDFAHLVPKSGSAFSGSYLKNITAVPGAEISIPFGFAASSDEYTLEVTGSENVTDARVSYNDASRTGNLFVGISDSNPIDSQTVTLTLTTEDETVSNTFTFVDNGARINLSTDGDVDWIGGEVKVTAETSNLGSGGYFSTNGAGLSYVNGIFAFDENTGGERTATVTYEVSLGSLRFNKSISVIQKANGTELSKTYYVDGADLELKEATADYTPLNIVVLGDGYKKKDLAAGGKFERSARQVLSVLFAVQPYKDFEDRFSVHMIGFESAEEGTDITSEEITKDTYFNSSFTGGGSTYATSDKPKIASVVRAMPKFAADADFYRTVVILLVNTDLVAGSCDYTDQTTISTDIVGDGFASFSIATLPANTTNINGLIRHELGGHGFGRLGDEYSQGWYDPTTIEQRHTVGFYYNVATNTSYWSKFTDAGYGSDEVTYDQYMDGPLYRSTNMEGIMWDNNGSFNAVSRWAIYDRIRKQTEGYGDYWNDFLTWDEKNR